MASWLTDWLTEWMNQHIFLIFENKHIKSCCCQNWINLFSTTKTKKELGGCEELLFHWNAKL